MNLGSYFSNRDYFYLMHLSYGTGREEDDREIHWNYAKRNNLIGLDLPSKVKDDWNNLSDYKKQKLRSEHSNWYAHFEMFCNKMKPDDLVVIANGHDSLLGFGFVTERRYYYRKKLSENRTFFNHVRKIEWEVAMEYSKRVELREPLKGCDRTLLRITKTSPIWKKLLTAQL